MDKIREIIEKCLKISKQTLDSLKDGEKIIKQGDLFGDAVNDTEIKADLVLGETIKQKIIESGLPCKITIEGNNGDYFTDVKSDKPFYGVCVDPLDGSLNFAHKGDTVGLPYSSCITVLRCNVGKLATFADVTAAGVIDLRSGDRWIAFKDEQNQYHTTLNGKITSTRKVERLDIGSMIVIGEMYYPQNRELLAGIFSGEKGWLRNPGSAAYEMALVSSGQVVLYICDRQKQHELGAAYALVKGAGGIAIDFEGKDLGSHVCDFKTQMPVILAANQKIADQMVQRINAGAKVKKK